MPIAQMRATAGALCHHIVICNSLLRFLKEAKDGGSRIAIIMNGSPLFTGDAGRGESEIRRYILEAIHPRK
jgi:type I restriction-modification system DNA methylase subunit